MRQDSEGVSAVEHQYMIALVGSNERITMQEGSSSGADRSGEATHLFHFRLSRAYVLNFLFQSRVQFNS